MLSAKFILTLLNIPGIGRRRINSIISCIISSPNNLNELRECVLLACKAKRWHIAVPDMGQLKKANFESIEMLSKSEADGIVSIAYGDSNYPKRFKQLKDPPVLIFAKGDTSILNFDRIVGIVGTREPTAYGTRCSHAIAMTFAKNGFAIASGLAKGSDTAAHRGCIDASGKTIAALAHGLHMVYPAQNRELAAEIIEKGGCLISEYVLGTPPQSHQFIERDRMQAGISDCLYVIETGIKGGTMHAVRSCTELKRPLACLSHPEQYSGHEKTQGNRMLIEQMGAIAVKDKDGLLDFVDLVMGCNNG